MEKKIRTIAIFILIPLVVGTVAGLLTMGGMEEFAKINKPPLSPPAWLFPVVWTILYTLMGISSYLVYVRQPAKKKGSGLSSPIENTKNKAQKNTEKSKALSTYGYQLLVNFLWPVFFFNFQWYFFAFLWLAFLWILVAKMILEFGEISKTAALLNVPYLLWLSFAGYLNLGIWLLN